MRQCVGVTGVTVVSVENHADPHRTILKRMLGSTKSMVVSTRSPGFVPDHRISLYGALFEDGAWALMRSPLGIGSKRFSFSWML